MTIEAFLPWTRWFLAFHVMSVMAWMAGMFYLPRLFVYHCQVQIGSEESARFKIMERRLLRAIINPAMISSLLFGIFLVLTPGAVDWHAGGGTAKWPLYWACLRFMDFVHGGGKIFEKDQNRHPERYYRIANEVPTVLMMIIVIMVIVRPF